jgi:hypothetical protein
LIFLNAHVYTVKMDTSTLQYEQEYNYNRQQKTASTFCKGKSVQI